MNPLLSIEEASRLGRIPRWKIHRLIREKVIFAPRGEEGKRLIARGSLGTLQKLAKQHFTSTGEFLHNPPVVAEYRGHAIDGVGTHGMRSIQ